MKTLKDRIPKPNRVERPRRQPDRTNAAGRKLIDALDEIVAAERSGTGLTIRHVDIPDPREYAPADVRALRDVLGISVALFARLTGVTAAQVEHWEQGRRTPNPTARRLFDRIATDPAGCLRELVVRR